MYARQFDGVRGQKGLKFLQCISRLSQVNNAQQYFPVSYLYLVSNSFYIIFIYSLLHAGFPDCFISPNTPGETNNNKSTQRSAETSCRM